MSFDRPDRRRLFRTIGARLTAWGAGVTFGVCLLVSAALYGGMWYSLIREVDSFLEEEVREFLGVVQEHGFNYSDAQQAIRLHLGSRTKIDLTFRVLDGAGRVLMTSHAPDLIPADYAVETDRLTASTAVFETLRIPGQAYPIRVCTLSAREPGGAPLVAQASYSLDQMSTSLAMIRNVSLAALLVAIILSVAAGKVMARRSLGPLHDMIQTARQISAHRVGERLPRSNTGDEFDRLAETLNGLLDRIDQYVQRMQQFTADASHELRSPLAALQGQAEVALARDRTAEELREVIGASLDQYRRLRKISDDLLLLARIDSEEDVLTRERIRLDQLIDDVVDLYEPTAGEAGLQMTFTRREPVDVIGDGGRLRQAIANLIDNAVKYTAAPGRVTVSLGCDNGWAAIEIRDTGVGITAEDLPHVCKRFYRADRARTTLPSSGAGLGLAICRSILMAHGGRITLHSTPGEGTCVRVELPRAGADASKDHVPGR